MYIIKDFSKVTVERIYLEMSDLSPEKKIRKNSTRNLSIIRKLSLEEYLNELLKRGIWRYLKRNSSREIKKILRRFFSKEEIAGDFFHRYSKIPQGFLLEIQIFY